MRTRHRPLHPVDTEPQGRHFPTTRPSIASATTSRTCSARLKDWRRVATRYDRCAHTFFSAICIAATVIFWLP